MKHIRNNPNLTEEEKEVLIYNTLQDIKQAKREEDYILSLCIESLEQNQKQDSFNYERHLHNMQTIQDLLTKAISKEVNK